MTDEQLAAFLARVAELEPEDGHKVATERAALEFGLPIGTPVEDDITSGEPGQER